MGGAAGKIRMMQVVGLNPHRDEPAEQRFEHGGIVVDAAQEHTLRQHRDPGAGQSPDRTAYRVRQFARVVRMHDDIDGLLGRERRDQRRTHAARIGDGHACVNADNRDMRDRLERLHDRAEAARRQQERVAAGDDDFPDFRVGADVIERAGELLGRQ